MNTIYKKSGLHFFFCNWVPVTQIFLTIRWLNFLEHKNVASSKYMQYTGGYCVNDKRLCPYKPLFSVIIPWNLTFGNIDKIPHLMSI
jgi:hypothetical protein